MTPLEKAQRLLGEQLMAVEELVEQRQQAIDAARDLAEFIDQHREAIDASVEEDDERPSQD